MSSVSQSYHSYMINMVKASNPTDGFSKRGLEAMSLLSKWPLSPQAFGSYQSLSSSKPYFQHNGLATWIMSLHSARFKAISSSKLHIFKSFLIVSNQVFSFMYLFMYVWRDRESLANKINNLNVSPRSNPYSCLKVL